MADYPQTQLPFEGYSLPDLRNPVLDGPGHGPVEEAAVAYTTLAETFHTVAGDIRAALHNAAAAHEGAAAAAARVHMERLALAGDEGAAQARLSAIALQDQVGYFARVRRDMAAIVAPEEGPPVFTPDPTLDALAQERATAQVEAVRVLAVDAAHRYQANTNHNTVSTFQIFVPPPESGLDVSTGPAVRDPQWGGDGLGAGAAGVGPAGASPVAAGGPAPGGLSVATTGTPAGTIGAPTATTGSPVRSDAAVAGSAGLATVGSGVPARSGVGPGGPVATDSRHGQGVVASSGPSSRDQAVSGANGPAGIVPAGGSARQGAVSGGGLPTGRGSIPDRGAPSGRGVTANPIDLPEASGWVPGQPWGSRPSAQPDRTGSAPGQPWGSRSTAQPDGLSNRASGWSSHEPRAEGRPTSGRPSNPPGESTVSGAAPQRTQAAGHGMPFFPGGVGGGAQQGEHRRPSWLVEDDPESIWMSGLPPHTDPVIEPLQD